jgi:hypothetical protein
MTQPEAHQLIDAALKKIALLSDLEEAYFRDARFAAIRWLPMYCRRVGTTIWAIEIIRGDRISRTTVNEMVKVMSADPKVQPAFFVPEGQPYEHLIPDCRKNGIAVIVKLSDEYETLVFSSQAGAPADQFMIRIPDWVVNFGLELKHLQPTFREALRTFSRKYKHLLESGTGNEERQEALLRNTFGALLRSDSRFAADYAPLDLLSFFERSRPEGRSRDHYFHTFNNFLLGCFIIDRCYYEFKKFHQSCFPGTREWSTEYAWLLAVLFHDIGYPIQKRQQTSEMIFGVAIAGEDFAVGERKAAWESPSYRISRSQLVSLYDHLTQRRIKSAWNPDPFPVGDHPLDKAFEHCFLREGHGVASCMRMLADFLIVPGGTAKHRRFLAQLIFVSGLSIPLHEWRVRKALRDVGIAKIMTSRFPFASLLMFIDSIQEDRRGKVQVPDILTGLAINGSTVKAEMNLSVLTDEKRREKRREALDVKDFLTEDVLHFDYPDELF